MNRMDFLWLSNCDQHIQNKILTTVVSAKYKNKQKYKLQKINYRKQNRDDATVASIGVKS